MVHINFQGMEGGPFVAHVGPNQPIRVGLDAFAAARMIPGALFQDPASRSDNFANGMTQHQFGVVRLLLDGQRIDPDTATPATLRIEDGPEHMIDVMFGQGGPADFPEPIEVYNTPAGALSYYQLEVRNLRILANGSVNHQLPCDRARLEQQLQQERQAHQQQLQQERQAQQAERVQLKANHQKDKQKLQKQLKDEQERSIFLKRLKDDGLEKIKDLRREKKAQEQEAAREVQLARLRSRASPAAGASPVAASPRTRISSRELRALLAVRA